MRRAANSCCAVNSRSGWSRGKALGWALGPRHPATLCRDVRVTLESGSASDFRLPLASHGCWEQLRSAGKWSPCPISALPSALGWVALGWVGLGPGLSPPRSHPGPAPQSSGNRAGRFWTYPTLRGTACLVSVGKSVSPETGPGLVVRCVPGAHWRDQTGQEQAWHSALGPGQIRSGTSVKPPGLAQG